jgi:clan AA aspartic protease
MSVRFISPAGEAVEVDSLVDTGATYSVVGSDVLTTLGVQPTGSRRFRLADESVVVYDVGEVRVEYEREQGPVLVVFGPEGSQPLLGATALKNLSLSADPVNARLVPVDALLK